MHDDHLQGILFHQSNYIDLVRYSRKQRFLQKVRNTQRFIKDMHPQPKLAANRLAQLMTTSRPDPTREAELNDLLSRFKVRD